MPFFYRKNNWELAVRLSLTFLLGSFFLLRYLFLFLHGAKKLFLKVTATFTTTDVALVLIIGQNN